MRSQNFSVLEGQNYCKKKLYFEITKKDDDYYDGTWNIFSLPKVRFGTLFTF